jgi:hypothetical protein
MKQISLRNSDKVALVDDIDYEFLKNFKWRISNLGYVFTQVGMRKSKEFNVKIGMTYIHRLVINPPSDKVCDHINLDKLDNRRENLRVCTRHENLFNRPKRKDSTDSKYIGVYFEKKSKKWVASFSIDKKQYKFRHESETDAALTYNKLAIQHRGQYARLNDI